MPSRSAAWRAVRNIVLTKIDYIIKVDIKYIHLSSEVSLSGGTDDRNGKASVARATTFAPHDRAADGRCSRPPSASQMLRLRSCLGRDRDLPLDDHLCRRRQWHSALSRLSDRRPCRALQLSRNLLAAAQ